jgi:hypothetical protein
MILIASTPMMGLLAASGLQGFLQLGFLFGRQIRVQHLATEGRHGGQVWSDCKRAWSWRTL